MIETVIAFRDSDIDNDIWCENVFVFRTNKDVEAFFVQDNPHLLELYTEEDDRILYDFEVHKSALGNIETVSFNSRYAGSITLSEMQAGYIIDGNA